MIIYIYMNIIILVWKNVLIIQKLILKKKNVIFHVMIINLNIIIHVYQIVQKIHIEYLYLEIYV